MKIIEIISIALGLAMDAFAVSICKGLANNKNKVQNGLLIGLFFGVFQALMPVLGYYLGKIFEAKIAVLDHWVAFGLLLIIGIGMIKGSFEKENVSNEKLDFITLIILSIATSIDAFAIGVTFAFLNVNLPLAIIIIGSITFVLSFIGYIGGSKIGNKFGNKAEFIGGLLLILLGTKILFDHLGIF